MNNITNIQKLYEFLSPALNVKLRLLRNRNYLYKKRRYMVIFKRNKMALFKRFNNRRYG